MNFPAEGIFHNIVLISIDKRYPGHARKIMNAVWGLGQLMFSKTVIVVDKDVDVQNLSEVAWIVGTHIDPERDIQFMRGPGGRSRGRQRPAGLRQQDGDRRHAQVGVRRVHAPVADAHSHHGAGGEAGGRNLDANPPGMEGMTAITIDEAQAILADRNLIAVGARGDDERRRRHGGRTTFVRVFEVHTDAIPAGAAGVGQRRRDPR